MRRKTSKQKGKSLQRVRRLNLAKSLMIKKYPNYDPKLDLSEEEIGRMWNEEPIREEDEEYEETQSSEEVQGDEESLVG